MPWRITKKKEKKKKNVGWRSVGQEDETGGKNVGGGGGGCFVFQKETKKEKGGRFLEILGVFCDVVLVGGGSLMRLRIPGHPSLQSQHPTEA